MTIYECKLCNMNMNISVYTIEKNDFICPSCLYEKKTEICCILCGEKTNFVSMTNKCLKCLKSSIFSKKV